MFDTGLIEEAERLVRAGYRDWLMEKGIIGYPESIDLIEGRIDLEEAIASVNRRTLNYARRQRTWFKKERGVKIEEEIDLLDICRDIEKEIERSYHAGS